MTPNKTPVAPEIDLCYLVFSKKSGITIIPSCEIIDGDYSVIEEGGVSSHTFINSKGETRKFTSDTLGDELQNELSGYTNTHGVIRYWMMHKAKTEPSDKIKTFWSEFATPDNPANG